MDSVDISNSSDGAVVSPEHYNKNHSFACIEVARHMGFAAGSAFKYLWRMGLKDKESFELGKTDWYIRDVLVHQSAVTLDTEGADRLIRVMTSIADEFKPDIFALLIALIDSCTGDYELLFEIAKERAIFTPTVHLMLAGE